MLIIGMGFERKKDFQLWRSSSTCLFYLSSSKGKYSGKNPKVPLSHFSYWSWGITLNYN